VVAAEDEVREQRLEAGCLAGHSEERVVDVGSDRRRGPRGQAPGPACRRRRRSDPGAELAERTGLDREVLPDVVVADGELGGVGAQPERDVVGPDRREVTPRVCGQSVGVADDERGDARRA
jgi:hypothetical protein